MATCRQCGGSGRETYEEDGRTVNDACYHCGSTGQVDEDIDFHDRVMAVAATLAYQAESEYRKAVNEDPYGDGYDLIAAENGLRSGDYFRTRVWDRTYEIAEKLAAMSQADQELLVAWHELPHEPWSVYNLPQVEEPVRVALPSSSLADRLMALAEDDDIPF